MNKVLSFILTIFLLNSCDHAERYYYDSGKLLSITKEDGQLIVYYENGKKKTITRYVNGLFDGAIIRYYPNGKIKETGQYVNGDKDKWFVWYDSTTTKKTEEAYFKKDEIYTHIKYAPNGRCTYYYMRPYIENADEDTLHLSKKDSLRISFFPKDSLFNFSEFIVSFRVVLNEGDKGFITVVYPKKDNYIYLDDSMLIEKILFHMYCQINYDKKQSCCDSIVKDYAYTSKYLILTK